MILMYTNCDVKAHKVQTVKLTMYKHKYKSWWYVLRKIKLHYKRSLSVILID